MFSARAGSLILVLVAAFGVIAQPIPPIAAQTAGTGAHVVESIRLLTDNGGRVAWSADGQWIYYDRRGPDGFFDLARIRPDGTANECLTCGRTDLPGRHMGNPTVHPSGRYVVFQAEKQSHGPLPAGTSSVPGGGAYNDLWVMDVSLPARPVLRLTDVPRDVFSGSLHAHFSSDGRRLLWTDFESDSGVFFDARLAVADLTVVAGRPSLTNTQYFNPGPQPGFLEAHGWGPGNTWVYFACTPVAGMAEENMDLCRMNLATPTQVSRLSLSSGVSGEPAEWDEHAHLSPLFDALSWVSSWSYGTLPGTPYRDWLRTDLWIQGTAAGARPQRATFFNDPGRPEHRGERVVVADHAWSPDGRQIAMYLQLFESDQHEIHILRLAPSP